jgi:hypothetical protein
MVSSIRSFFVLGAVLFCSNLHPIDIFYEISQNNLKAVQKWAASKPDVSVVDERGQSPLHAAVLAGKVSLVKAVLKSNVDVNAVDIDGQTALDLAVDHGYGEIVLMLVKKHAKVTTPASLAHAQVIVDAYVKKLLKRFAIMLPLTILATILTLPLWLPIICFQGGALTGVIVDGLLGCYCYLVFLPFQASAWIVRSKMLFR